MFILNLPFSDRFSFDITILWMLGYIFSIIHLAMVEIVKDKEYVLRVEYTGTGLEQF